MKKKLKLSIISFILTLCINGFSQTPRIFQINLDEMNLKYKAPKSFSVKDSVYNFFFYTKDLDKKKQKFLYPFTYRIKSEKNNMLIGFVLLPLKLVDDSTLVVKSFFPNSKKNDDYLQKIKHKFNPKDGGKLVEYSQKICNDKFNSDKSGTYSFYLEVPYENKYHYCDVVYMHKENIGDAEIYYFHNNKNKIKLSKYLDSAFNILQFKR